MAVSGSDVRPYEFLWANAKSMELGRSPAHFYAFLGTRHTDQPKALGPGSYDPGTWDHFDHNERDGVTCGM